VTFGIIFFIYLRITLMTLHAIDSGILPSARDVCSYWRWHNGNFLGIGDHMLGVFMTSITTCFASISFFPWDINHEIEKMADPELGGFCREGFERMSVIKACELFAKHPSNLISFILTFAALLLLPEFVYSTGALQTAIRKLDLAGVETQEEVEDTSEKAEEALTESLVNSKKLTTLARSMANHLLDTKREVKRLDRELALLSGRAPASPLGQRGLPRGGSSSLQEAATSAGLQQDVPPVGLQAAAVHRTPAVRDVTLQQAHPVMHMTPSYRPLIIREN